MATRDIAFANLRWAVGLPDFDEAAIPELQQKLNDWASAVRTLTERLLPQFQANPSRFEGTPGKFRMLALITVLQRDFGVTYNQAFMQGEYDGRDPRNLFLHGVLTGFGGTCVTLPLLYIAIGRRLRYPLFLVEANEHYFVRWEGAGERFNVEATSRGFRSDSPDEYYHDWPKPIPAEDLAKGRFLRNLTPREEVASCWNSRGRVFLENLRLNEAVEAFDQAEQMGPALPGAKNSFNTAIACGEILLAAATSQILPIKKAIESAAPPTTQPWQAPIISHGKQELLRILRNFERSGFTAKARPYAVKVSSSQSVKASPPQPQSDDATGGDNSGLFGILQSSKHPATHSP